MTIKINVVPTDIPISTFSAQQRDRVEIAGRDVTPDLIEIAALGASLDVESLNNFKVSEASFSLRNTRGKYNSEVADNFWSQHDLNPEGFQEKIEIFKEYLVSGNWTRVLQFAGFLQRTAKRENGTVVSFTAVDISTALRNRQLHGIGTREKWGTARAASDESTYQQVFAPEASLVPMVGDGNAWQGEQALTRRELALPTEGPPLQNTFYPTPQDIRLPTAVGEQDPPLVRSPAQLRSQNLHALIRRVALHLDELPFQVKIDADPLPVETPYILNRGSRAFDVEQTRITHLPVDWVYDVTHKQLLMLLSNPESHIADLLVSYDLESERTRVLHTFEKTLAVHRIERHTAVHAYILTSDTITQDGSARTVPRQSDKTGYSYDSVAQGSRIRIHRYDVNSSMLTEHVPHTNTYPPQLGLHYYVGFENAFQTDEFEGIRSAYRGAFKWHGSHLYYRYAKDSEFGVARVNASGVTTRLIYETDLVYHNHLNFAFDVTETDGTVYFAQVTGTENNSTLTLKSRTSGGTETTVLSDTQTLSALDGTYLGVHECLFHSDSLYLLVEIGQVDVDTSTDPDTYSRSRTKTAGMVLYRCDVTAQTPSLTLIEKWDFVHQAGCNLTVHAGNVHYVENSKVATRFKPYNPDAASFNEHLGYNAIPESLGALKRIERDGRVTNLGNWWHEDGKAWNLALTRCLSIGSDLHVTMAYGDPDAVLRLNSLASKPDNAQHLVHTRTLQETLLDATVRGNIWSTLVALTTLLDATVSIENNVIHIRSRRVTKALTAGATGTGSGSLTFKEANKAFPSSGGYLLIGEEALRYTGMSGNPPNPPYQRGMFTGVQRGVLGSAIADHADSTQIVFAKYVFGRERLVGRVTPITDTGKLYNVIRDSQGVVSVRDAASVAKFGEKVLTLDFSRLSVHEATWQAAIFQQYLANLKDLQQLMTFSLLPSRYLRLGDVIGLRYEGSLYAIQVLSLRHTPTRTEIRGRTISFKGRVGTGIYSDGHGNMYSDGHGNIYTDGV